MKRYHFMLTRREAWEFAVRIVWEQRKFWVGRGILLACLLAVNFWLMSWVSVFLLAFLAVIWVIVVVSLYKQIQKEQCESERTVWLDEGWLKLEYGEYVEAPLECIEVIRVTQKLLMLGRYWAKKQLAWYVIPLRVFESPQERESFISRIRLAKASQETVSSASVFDWEKAFFRFRFRLDEHAWLEVSEEILGTQFSGRLGNEDGLKLQKTYLAVYGGICVLFGCFWVLFNRGRMGLTVLFVLVFLYIALLRNRLLSPRERSKKLLKRGQLQSDIYGDCELAVFEEYVVQRKNEKETAMFHWDSLGWVVDTEHAFCLVKKDCRVFLLTLKNGVWNQEQAQAFLTMCERKGLTYVRGQTKKFLPGWFFGVLSGICIVSYLMAMVLLAVRDGRREAAKGNAKEESVSWEQTEEFRPKEYHLKGITVLSD